MGGRLTLRFRAWGDGTGELLANVSADGFSGIGRANFNLESIQELARKLAKFPLDMGETIHIEGGYWSSDNASVLVQEHLYLGVSPRNSHGALAFRIRLACPQDDANRPEPRGAVSVETNIEYQQLAKFAVDLEALAVGNCSEVSVELMPI
jgi:hypothetical protein